MNLIEAVKSGRMFRRRSCGPLISLDGQQVMLCKDDILADDWELGPCLVHKPRYRYNSLTHRCEACDTELIFDGRWVEVKK